MKKTALLFLAILSITTMSFATTKKKKKVIHSSTKTSTSATATSKSSAKVDDVATQKKPMSASFQAWLKEMKKRVSKTTSQKNQIVSVAAVRGSETPDSPPLYWKGKKAEGKVEAPELKEFDAALDTAMNGDQAAAKDKLQSFIIAYPNSALKGDAEETLARLEAPASADTATSNQ